MLIPATSIKYLDNLNIEVTYIDGKVFRFDFSTMLNKYPSLSKLQEYPNLFKKGKLDKLGYGIIWNDDLDFDTSSIYEEGKLVKIINIPLKYQVASLLLHTRVELGITQVELAKLSNIDQADISKIERGIGNITVNTIDKLFSCLGKKVKLELD